VTLSGEFKKCAAPILHSYSHANPITT
jgi:hypothetical protein